LQRTGIFASTTKETKFQPKLSYGRLASLARSSWSGRIRWAKTSDAGATTTAATATLLLPERNRPPYYFLNGTEDRARRRRRLGETDPTARLGAGELGDGLGALVDGVLGELTEEDEADGGL